MAENNSALIVAWRFGMALAAATAIYLLVVAAITPARGGEASALETWRQQTLGQLARTRLYCDALEDAERVAVLIAADDMDMALKFAAPQVSSCHIEANGLATFVAGFVADHLGPGYTVVIARLSLIGTDRTVFGFLQAPLEGGA